MHNIYNRNNKLKMSDNMKKNVVKLNEEKLRKIISESIKKTIKENAAGCYPEKLLYYPGDGTLSGDMGYDYLDKGELGGNPETIISGIYEYLRDDYPEEKEEMYDDCAVVLYLGCWNAAPEKLYVSSLDRQYANEICVASEKKFGTRVPVEVVEATGNAVKLSEAQLKKIVSESIKKALKERR